MLKKRGKSLLCGILVSVICTLFSFEVNASASAVSVDPSNPIVANNDFIIPKNPEKVDTKVTVSNGSYKSVTKQSKDDEDLYKSFQKDYGQTTIEFKDDESVLNKAEVNVDYGYVGTYKGKTVGVKMHIYDFVGADSKYSTGNGYLRISDNLFSGFYFAKIADMKIDFVVYDESGKEVSLENTYIGFNSLNSTGAKTVNDKSNSNYAEGVSYNKMADNNYYVVKDTLLQEITNPVTNTGNVVIGQTEQSEKTIEWNTSHDKLGDQEFTKSTVSFLVTGTKNIFELISQRGLKGGGTWISFSSATLFNVIPETPKKIVESNGVNVDGKEVLPGQQLEYKISQKVNTLGVDLLSRYTKFEISDILPSQVTYQSAKLVDKDGKELDPDGSYSYDKDSHTLVYKASKNYLESMELNGETVYLSVITKVNTDVTTADTIINKASVTINSSNKNTNEVENKVKDPVIKDPVKTVSDSEGDDFDGKTIYAGEQLVFDVSQTVNTMGEDIEAPYSKFVLKDTLDEKVSFVKAEVLKGAEVVKDVEGLAYDEKTHTVSFTASQSFLEAMEMKGETYVLKIYTEVISEIAEGQTIVNKATALIDRSEKETNETTNPIGVPKGNIELTKLTNQLVGIKTNVKEESQKSNSLAYLISSFEVQANADSVEDPKDSNGLVYEKRPQSGVTYELTAREDIVFPNNELIDKKGTSYGTYTTDESGKIKIDDLYSGSYQLQEISAPVGIQVDPDPIDVELAAGEGEKEIAVSTEHTDPLQEVKIDFTKYFENEDGTFTAGEGATFGLYYGKNYELEDGSQIKAGDLVATLEPDKEGNYVYQAVMIPKMEYYVSEISTREGYQKLLESFRFVYDPTNNNAVSEITLFANGYQVDGKMKTYLEASEVVDEAEETKASESTADTQTSTETNSSTSEEASTESKETTAETSDSSTERSTEGKTEDPEAIEQAPIENILIKESLIDKKILTTDQKLVTDYQLLSEQESVTFVGTVTIGDEEKGLPITISDNLPEGFSYKDYRVADAEGKDVTDKTSVEVKDQLVVVTLAQEYADTLTRTQLTLTLETVYNYDSAHEGKTFENIFDLAIGDKVISSEKVTLTAPAEKEEVPLPQTGTDMKRFIGVALLILATGLGSVIAYRYRAIKK